MILPAAVLAGAGVTLVELHGPGGQPLDINPAEVSSVRAPLNGGNRAHWGPDTRCVLVMSNGRFNAVTESCETVLEKLRGH